MRIGSPHGSSEHRRPPRGATGNSLFLQSLSRQTTAHSLSRCRTKQTPHLSKQQFLVDGIDHRRTVSVSLAIRTLLQMDQQHLRIKAFYGTTENAVKTQIWIAIAVYVLVAIVKKQLHLDLGLYTILQILSVTLFEKTPILGPLSIIQPQESERILCNQLTLFD